MHVAGLRLCRGEAVASDSAQLQSTSDFQSISPQSLMVTVWLGVPSSVPAASISLRAQFEPRAEQQEGTEKRRSAYRSTRKPSMAVPCSHTLFAERLYALEPE